MACDEYDLNVYTAGHREPSQRDRDGQSLQHVWFYLRRPAFSYDQVDIVLPLCLPLYTYTIVGRPSHGCQHSRRTLKHPRPLPPPSDKGTPDHLQDFHFFPPRWSNIRLQALSIFCGLMQALTAHSTSTSPDLLLRSLPFLHEVPNPTCP